MAEAVLEKAVCEECGSDVRDGTTFCYNCGSRVVPEETIVEEKPEISEAQIEKPITEPTESEKKARSAEQRRRSRIRQRKVVEYTWEPAHDSRWLVIAAIVIFVVVIVVVIAAVWK